MTIIGEMRLCDLEDGREAEITKLDAECQGMKRKRLLDLGLTPGANVRAELRSALGKPRAFRVRGTLLALRENQAKSIWVRALDLRQ